MSRLFKWLSLAIPLALSSTGFAQGDKEAQQVAKLVGQLYEAQKSDRTAHSEYTHSDEKVLSMLVIKNGETAGVFTDEHGKEHKVTPLR